MNIVKQLIASLLYFVLNIFFVFGLRLIFLKIEASRIGHLLTNIDQSIYYLEKKKENYILSIFLNGKISNEYAVSLWKKNKKIFFFNLVQRIINASNYNVKLKKFILDWKTIQPYFTELYSSKPNFLINKKKSSFMKDNNIFKDFVCLHNRDDFFSKQLERDKNFLSYKNFDFRDFNLTIKQIQSNNHIPIRIGMHVDKEKMHTELNYLDMTGAKSNFENDILLQRYAKFTIIGSTGLAAISTTLRKPVLYINYTPLNLGQLSYVSKSSLVMPKLIKNKSNGKLLKFSEISNLNFDIHQTEDFIKKQELEMINNNNEEILNAYTEMNNLIDGQVNELTENLELNKAFFYTLGNKEYAKYLLENTKIRLPYFFLKKYVDLI